jgi:type II secretory pathway component PulF
MLNLGEQILFFNQMTTMLAAGLPLLKSLESVGANSPSGRLRNYARSLAVHISRGESVSDSMEKVPGIHDLFIVNMVRLGEQTGFLDARFKEITQFLEKINSFRMQFLTHMIYPIIVFHVGVLLPPLFFLFTGNPERYLTVTLSVLLPFYGLIVFGTVLYLILRNVKEIVMIYDFTISVIPIVSGIVKKSAISRFTRAFASLYDAGLGLSQGVKVAAAACGNSAYGKRLQAMAPVIDKGNPLTQAMAGTRLFPPMVLQMVSTGEETGDVAHLLRKVSEYLDEQLEATVKRFFIILPILFYLVMGAFIGYVFITQFLRISGEFMKAFGI